MAPRKASVRPRPMGADLRARYLAAASHRFREAFAGIEAVVGRRLPGAEAAFAYGMPGWRIPRTSAPPPEATRGTIDPNYVHIFLVERKAGITLHLWNPGDWAGLERARGDLESAGFRVMRGCLQFQRKAPLPFDPVDRLLQRIRSSL